MPDDSDLQATVFGDDSTFHSTFLAVTAPSATVAARSIVRLTTDQNVPTNAVGSMVQWSRAIGRNNFFSSGFDWRHVDGDSLEDVYIATPGAPIIPPTAPATLSLQRNSGGSQTSVAGFLQDVISVNNLVVTLSARVDGWQNRDGHIIETNVSNGQPSAGNRPSLEDRDDTVVSPRGAALYRISDRVSVWGDIGWGFRAPTLNELYRQFSVGLVRTLANENLGPERLFGGEAGVRLEATRNTSLRSTWYDNRVKNPVSNVTIGTNLQQRQNLGRTRIRGWQTDVETRLNPSVRITAGYLFNDAKVTEYAANPALVGLYLPQVPKHRGSVGVSYSNPRLVTVAATAMFFGRQYDDDLNQRTKPGETEPGLPPYGVLDLSVSRDIGRNVSVFFGAQNLFDQEYYVMLLPTTTGSPRLVNGGIRVRFSGR
jgi:outer membrane receptor protein involved in Fe transport